MVRNDFGHQHGDLVWCVEFARLLAGIGSKLADKVFVDESQYVIVLLAIHRNILNQLEQIAHSSCLFALSTAQVL